MERSVSVAEAKRSFSRPLRSVWKGHSYVITDRGRPVAKITPVSRSVGSSKARTALLKRLNSQQAITIPGWRREELYENE